MAAKPRALVLSPEVPYPAHGGGRLRTACLLDWLGRHYEVDLITFLLTGDAPPVTPPGLIRAVLPLPIPPHSSSFPARAARNLGRAWRGVPSLVDRFGGQEVRLRLLLAGQQYDLGLIEHFWCAPYGPVLRPFCRRLVLDLHNIESVLARRAANRTPRGLLQSYFAGLYRTLEQDLMPQFDVTLVTSLADAQGLPVPAVVVPNAIPLRPLPAVVRQDTIIFTGNLAYEPNVQGLTWFRRHVWPILRQRRPNLRWQVVGLNPDAVRAALAGDPSIELTGPVPDIEPYLAIAAAAVVPLLSGSGTRFKILEAWLTGTPVITTTLGAEGLDGTSGEHWLAADTPAAFAEAVLTVLDRPDLRQRLAACGRHLCEERYSWPAAHRALASALAFRDGTPGNRTHG